MTSMEKPVRPSFPMLPASCGPTSHMLHKILVAGAWVAYLSRLSAEQSAREPRS